MAALSLPVSICGDSTSMTIVREPDRVRREKAAKLRCEWDEARQRVWMYVEAPAAAALTIVCIVLRHRTPALAHSGNGSWWRWPMHCVSAVPICSALFVCLFVCRCVWTAAKRIADAIGA